MYRSVDPRARCQEAHAHAEASFRALVEMRGRVLPLVARSLASGGPAPMIPDYSPLEPFPHGLPDAMIEQYTKRFADLAAYYAAENRRLAGYVEGATAELRDALSPAPLGPGPRAVPFSYVLAETMGGYWILLRWFLFPPITMVVLMALGATSMAHPLLALVPLAVIAIVAAIRAKRRIAVLRHGEVPEIVSRTVSLGSGSMKNWPMTFTQGWRTEVRGYSGSSRVTHFQYRTSRGTFGATSISGVEYNGVVVCHPDDPSLAFGIPDFGSKPRPDARGQWDASLPLRVWAATLTSIALVLAWIAFPFVEMVLDLRLVDVR